MTNENKRQNWVKDEKYKCVCPYKEQSKGYIRTRIRKNNRSNIT